MEYYSTRGKIDPVSESGAILSGIPQNGGLYVSDHLPRTFRDGDMATLAWLSHSRRIAHIISMFIRDITFNAIVAHAEEFCTRERFGANTTPIVPVGGHRYLELWHSPTGSVDELSVGMLPRLWKEAQLLLEREEKPLYLVSNREMAKAIAPLLEDGAKAVFCSPDGDFPAGNDTLAACLRVEADSPTIAATLAGSDIAKVIEEAGYRPVRTDSANWLLFLSRAVVYISAYCEMVLRRHLKFPGPMNLSLCGDDLDQLAAAWFARKLGLNVGRVLCGSAPGSILAELLLEGTLTKSKLPGGSLPAALERILYELGERDSSVIDPVVAGLERDGVYTLPANLIDGLREDLWLCVVDEAEIQAAMTESAEEGYPISREAAMARIAADRYIAETGDGKPMLLAALRAPGEIADSNLSPIGLDEIAEAINSFLKE